MFLRRFFARVFYAVRYFPGNSTAPVNALGDVESATLEQVGNSSYVAERA